MFYLLKSVVGWVILQAVRPRDLNFCAQSLETNTFSYNYEVLKHLHEKRQSGERLSNSEEGIFQYVAGRGAAMLEEVKTKCPHRDFADEYEQIVVQAGRDIFMH